MQISYQNFRKSLESFDVHFSEKEFDEVISYSDSEQTGHVRYCLPQFGTSD
jgi:Ca2+-binding EF-hand superfamily protein